MPRPNPPRKRPRRRPDAVERSAKAEVSLAKQTANAKSRNGAPEPKAPNVKPQTVAKASRSGPAPRARRVPEPYSPWSKRSYAILIAVLAVGELAVGTGLYATLSGNIKINLGLFLLVLNEFNPLVAIAAAILAAPIAKFITKETRSLRFMESAMAGVVQFFVWFVLSLGVTYAVGGLATTTAAVSHSGGAASSATATPLPTASTSGAATASPSGSSSGSSSAATTVTIVTATPGAIAGLAVVDVLSFVITFYVYPPLYRRLRLKPPPPRQPRPPKDTKPKEKAA